jgi:uncharacterized protein
LQGFLFAVASAPELVRPSEWLPVIFNEHDAGYATLDEANAILQQLMALYNDINAAVLEQRVTLPIDCDVHACAVDNLRDASPLAQWSSGFMTGHDWLTELWSVPLPDDLDEELGAVVMILSFFSSRRLAEAFHAEGSFGDRSLEDMANHMLALHPEAMAEYAHIGRSILGPAFAEAARTPRRVDRIGRNDRCPCGSGKKFKRCCGSGPAAH